MPKDIFQNFCHAELTVRKEQFTFQSIVDGIHLNYNIKREKWYLWKEQAKCDY